MGTQGMKATPLISREVIADSIELVARSNLFDGLICIAGCDKNMPAAIMALGRLDIPGLMLYGGSIAPGNLPQPDGTTKEITILQVFEGMGSHAAGKINDDQLEALEAVACPGPGACGGQFTANTMAMAGEFLGISPMHDLPASPQCRPEQSTKPAAPPAAWSWTLARAGLKILTQDPHPQSHRERHTPPSAHPAAAPTPSSTSSPSRRRTRHPSSAMADFDRISEHTPFICDRLSPGGKYAAKDYQDAGGSRLLAATPPRAGLLDGSQPSPSPASRSPKRPSLAVETLPTSKVICPCLDNPRSRPPAGLVILRGNLAPRRLRRQGRRP